MRICIAGRIRCIAVDTPVPSAFSHEILNANPYAYLDDAPLEERRARAVEMRRVLPEALASEFGRLDPAAIAQVRADAWPDVRDADELHDALCYVRGVAGSWNAGDATSLSAQPGLLPQLISAVDTGIGRLFRGIDGAAARSTRATGRPHLLGMRGEGRAAFPEIFGRGIRSAIAGEHARRHRERRAVARGGGC